MRERRPHVTLKAAMTLDGKIADTHGTARWITGERARAHAHRLRSEADAIVVGVATVLRDDPELTVRLDAPWPREPYRVALHTHGRTPPRPGAEKRGEAGAADGHADRRRHPGGGGRDFVSHKGRKSVSDKARFERRRGRRNRCADAAVLGGRWGVVGGSDAAPPDVE